MQSSGSREESGYYGYFADHNPSDPIEPDYTKGNNTIENQDGWETLISVGIKSLRSVKPHKNMLNEYDESKNSKIINSIKAQMILLLWIFILNIYRN